ncbi:MAG: hypothetical protein M1150_01155 [Patescibacteria group bacterium]|nr:hypothetical protein [Patescibacteria group bacterium]
MSKINKENLKTFLADEMAALEIYQGVVENFSGNLTNLEEINQDLKDLKNEIRNYRKVWGSGTDWLKETLGFFGKFGVKVGLMGANSDLRDFEDLQKIVSGAYGTKVGWWQIKEVAQKAGDYQLAKLARGAIALSENQLEELERVIRLVSREAFLEKTSLEMGQHKFLEDKV